MVFGDKEYTLSQKEANEKYFCFHRLNLMLSFFLRKTFMETVFILFFFFNITGIFVSDQKQNAL